MGSSERAAFVPFPTHLDLKDFVNSRENIVFATRITCDSIDEYPLENFEDLVYTHVIRLGKPLVIEGFEERLDQNLFSPEWLRKYKGTKVEECRDLVEQKNKQFSIAHYLNNMSRLTENSISKRDKRHVPQRLYLKDIDCPEAWHKSLESIIPPSLFYFNESPKPYKGPGSKYAEFPDFPQTKDNVPIARAGDLMSSLPEDMRANNLMCYIGHEGTYTAAHQEMCGSLSQNLMVEASDGDLEDGKKTRPGSSIWLMTETHERPLVAEYWKSMLGHDLDLEAHFAQLEAWKRAPFTTYVVEQTPGDLVLVPPLSVQQVWNRGTRTMKVAWNRTTVETLQWALDEELSRARVICRDEQYKNKAIIFYTLEKYSKLLQQDPGSGHPGVDALWTDFENLFIMFTDVLLSECFSTDLSAKKQVEYLEFTSDVTCSYCRCNIFNRFLTCPSCIDGEETYDICMDCYVFGRSCRCISKLNWVEQFHWKELMARHEKWRGQIMGHYGKDASGRDHVTFSAIPRMRKSVAELCQDQLRVRPWVDCNGAPPPEKLTTPSESESEEVHGRRSAKRRKTNKAKNKTGKSKKKQKPEDMGRCHTCEARPLWTLKSCSTCESHYCYGCLFRLFDLEPQQAMQPSHWECPKCLKICSCASCTKKSNGVEPYLPKKLLLGHDTYKVADVRSVESLVNLRRSNGEWMKKFQRTKNTMSKNHFFAKRFEQLKREADEARLALDETRTISDAGSLQQAGVLVETDGVLALAEQNEISFGPTLDPTLDPTFNPAPAEVVQVEDGSIIREDFTHHGLPIGPSLEFQPNDFPVDPSLELSNTFMALDPALGYV